MQSHTTFPLPAPVAECPERSLIPRLPVPASQAEPVNGSITFTPMCRIDDALTTQTRVWLQADFGLRAGA